MPTTYVTKQVSKLVAENIALAAPSFTFAASHGAGTLAPSGTNVVTVATANSSLKPDLFFHVPNNIVGEIIFSFADRTYVTVDGIVYISFDTITGVGTAAGAFDRASGIIKLSGNVPSSYYLYKNPIFKIISMTVDEFSSNKRPAGHISFRTSISNVNSSSLQIRGSRYQIQQVAALDENSDAFNTEDFTAETAFTVTVDVATNMLIGDVQVDGDFDGANGTVTIFGLNGWVIDPDSIRYDAVSEVRMPMNAELLGLNPVRLPSTGKVPVINNGDTLVIFNEEDQVVVPVAGATVSCGRIDVALMEVIDSQGLRLDYHQYSVDRDLGELTFEDPLSLVDISTNTLIGPYKLVNRIENMRLASNVDITGNVSVTAPPDRDFPAGSQVASALVWGDTGARVFNFFHQESWNSGSPVWSDARIGDDTTAKYDAINNPFEVVNKGSMSERWTIRFISSTGIQVIGEKLGVVLDNHSISLANNDIAPINPSTGSPYFIIRQVGFGTGWVTNNVIRFNTDGANQNMWAIRTTQPGAATENKDAIEIEVRGDAN
ncbi:hypothetical protein [Neptunomonas japonica]|uniref:hypothetical protein n=1 Tax=Neptunomonas japonica TaxID=417574 RepID=UPI00042A27A1|nr:hypothetical protein [Neptunomonas japonica]